MNIFSILAALLIVTAPTTVTVHGAYSRPATDMGVVFLTIVNTGASDDKLDGARSNVAGATEVHETYVVDGGEGMRHVAFVAIPAGKSVTFKSGGYHIMLIGLHHELHPGDRFTIGLHFGQAGWVDVPVTVRGF
jgi:periplasmic copper chaperone A